MSPIFANAVHHFCQSETATTILHAIQQRVPQNVKWPQVVAIVTA